MNWKFHNVFPANKVRDSVPVDARRKLASFLFTPYARESLAAWSIQADEFKALLMNALAAPKQRAAGPAEPGGGRPREIRTLGTIQLLRLFLQARTGSVQSEFIVEVLRHLSPHLGVFADNADERVSAEVVNILAHRFKTRGIDDNRRYRSYLKTKSRRKRR